MEGSIHLAIDAMSGDHGPKVVVPAALQACEKYEDLCLTLVGDSPCLTGLLTQFSRQPRIRIHHAPDVVSMDERPSHALRKKQNSSMAVALRMVREGEAQGCVSAGNTGALMLLARAILKTCPGIDRPAIVKKIPSLDSWTYVLDLGANVDSSAEHLFQFALLGAALVEAVEGRERPRVALLNVGEEDIKGTEQVRLASRMLIECDAINYIGYVEGGDIFKPIADVVVCDGFVGNVALKSGEGVAELVLRLVERGFERNVLTRLLGWLARPLMQRVRRQLDPASHNGATLAGLQGVVIKSHGNADARAVYSAIRLAREEALRNVPEHVNTLLDDIL
ncbi:MAG: phosphate acyltransferase PlsX [Gammaproteobacteria bacterium]|nr:MAG: phosphate acyltransferase PlsX [Gammaproteobacteria bacterium]